MDGGSHPDNQSEVNPKGQGSLEIAHISCSDILQIFKFSNG